MENQKNSYSFFAILLNIQMNIRMYFKIFIFFIFLYVIFIFSIVIIFEHEYFNNIINLFSAFFNSLVNFNFANADYNLSNATNIFLGIMKYVMIKTWYVFILLPVAFYLSKFLNNKKSNHIRGAKITTVNELKKALLKEKCSLPFGQIEMPIDAEIKHSFIVGRPGTGKTNCINQIIEALIKRNSKTLIYDFKGDFLTKFYNSTNDLIFNPLDKRCVGWNIWNDIDTVMDINAVAAGLIPESSKNADPFWNNSARDIFIGVLHYCFQKNLRTNKGIWETCKLHVFELATVLRDIKGAEAANKHFEDLKSKILPSIMSIFMQNIKAFEYMQYIDGDFSIKKWLAQTNNNRIYLTNYADIKDTLKPILSMFIDVVGRKLLSMHDDIERRVFFLLDEFGTLQRLNTIIQLLTLSRSKGGAVFIGIQDVGQIDNLYGKELRASIINSCGNNLIFSVKDPVTADFFSEKIGDTEYYEDTQGHSYGEKSDRINVNQQKRKERLILPSDIMNLRDLSGYLMLVNYNPCLTLFNYKNYKNHNIPFIMQEKYTLDKESITLNNVDVNDTDIEIHNQENSETPVENTTCIHNKAISSKGLFV